MIEIGTIKMLVELALVFATLLLAHRTNQEKRVDHRLISAVTSLTRRIKISRRPRVSLVKETAR